MRRSHPLPVMLSIAQARINVYRFAFAPRNREWQHHSVGICTRFCSITLSAPIRHRLDPHDIVNRQNHRAFAGVILDKHVVGNRAEIGPCGILFERGNTAPVAAHLHMHQRRFAS